jgi:hypothetical protein
MILYAEPETCKQPSATWRHRRGTSYLEVLRAVSDDHVVPVIDGTLLNAQPLSYGARDQFGGVSPGKEQAGEDDGEIGVAHILLMSAKRLSWERAGMTYVEDGPSA